MKISIPMISAMLALSVLIFGGTGCSKRARKERILSSANRDFQAGDYDKAEVEYRSALQIPPMSVVAVRQLGFMYFDEGRASQAFPYLNKAAQLEPTNADVQVKLASAFITAHKFKEARQAALKALNQRPGDDLALQFLAETASVLRDGPQIRQTIEKMRQDDQDRSGYHLGLAVLDLQRQDVADGAKELQQALALNPKSSEAYYLLGEICLQGRDLTQAQHALEYAAQLSPLRSQARLGYAEFQWQTGATNQAQTNLEQLTQQAPDYISAWLALMKLELAEHKFDECRSIIKTILGRDPINYEALMQSGTLSLIQRDSTNATATFLRMQEYYKTSPQVGYELALSYLLAGDKVKAVASLNQALFNDAQFSPAIITLAELDIRGNRPTAAVALLQPLTKKQPTLAKAKLLLADAYLAAQNPADALAVYRQLAETFPQDPQLPLLIGTILEQQRNLPAARQAFEKSLELAPDYPAPLEKMVDLDVSEQHYDAARERVESAIQRHPKAALGWMLKAKVYLAQRQFTEAETALLQAIDLNPNLPNPYLMLTRVYISTGKYQQALDRLTALAAHTNSVPAMLQIGQIHDQLKQYDAARDAYEKALTFNPQASVALNNLAYLYSERYRDFDKALKMAERARELLPYDASTADTVGWVLFRKGQYARALPFLQEAADGQPASAEVQFHLGSAHYMMGEEAPARVALQRAASLGGDFSAKDDAKRQLALLSVDPRTADAAAIAELERASKNSPADPVALVRLAAIRERDGRAEEAASIYEKVLTSVPENLQAILKLAELYAGALHEPQKALALAKTAHQLAPEDASASAVLGQLVYKSGDYGWSLNLLEEAAQNKTDSPDLLYDLAWAYYANGNVTQAESSVQRAIQLKAPFSRLEDARHFLAMLEASQSAARTQAAAAQASATLQSNPNYVPALMVTALAQEQQGDLSQAQQLCEKMLAIYPEFTPAVRLSGIVAYRRNDFAQSEQLLRRTVLKTGGDDEVNYYLGMDYFQLKRLTDSKQALQRAVDLNPRGKFAAEAKLALAKLK